MNRIIELIKGTRLGQAFDNLLRETSGDGFKSKCVVASYLSVAQCGLVSFIIVLIMLVIYAVGVFTNVPVAGDIMIEFLKIVKDILGSDGGRPGHLGLLDTNYTSSNITQFEANKLSNSNGGYVQQLNIVEGVPIMYVKKDQTYEWEPVFKDLDDGDGNAFEVAVVLAYTPFNNELL